MSTDTVIFLSYLGNEFPLLAQLSKGKFIDNV